MEIALLAGLGLLSVLLTILLAHWINEKRAKMTQEERDEEDISRQAW